MKKIIFWTTLIFILAFVNFLILKKEEIRSEGKKMLLKLAPVDPRSLMQGDYMILRYAIARRIPKYKLKNKGNLVVSLDKNNVAKFVRLDENEPLKVGEYFLSYKNRDGVWLGAESFFFQEGNAELYSNAQYAELMVDKSGKSLLIELGGKDFNRITKIETSY